MNYKFYAHHKDFEEVFKFIFEELGLSVFQSYSEYGQPLNEYGTEEEVMNELAKHPVTQFVLWEKDFGFEYIINKLELTPKYCNGHTFRYRIDGWGLIHLQANDLKADKIEASSISHNTEKRAQAWESTKPEFGKADELNWNEINSTSRKLKNFISKQLTKSKRDGTDVLANAKEYIESVGIK